MPRPEGDYISLTDMARNFVGAGALIEQWLKNKDTILFLGVWERINNPHFNSPEFEGIRNEAGRNSFFLSAKKWIHLTGASRADSCVLRSKRECLSLGNVFRYGQWIARLFVGQKGATVFSGHLCHRPRSHSLDRRRPERLFR